MLFHAHLQPRVPAHLTREMAEDYQARQQRYIQSLIDERVALHVWRGSGTRQLFVVFEAESHVRADEILRAFPLARYTDVLVNPVAAIQRA
ncbi:muconolactone Delta-isomerase family protein [Corynebacterium pilosum]|uniref:Muconolactone isomerase n=1 Tax=Corynebacterium pilosum TaxID=35756 RepID=A0A376CNV2_9CORY|nr:muconolactone Delta-isomerase family protein [Corynebacterium pilosum]STC70196.1 muconolactone isomerase [Corynebacterium pilosum]